MRQSSQLATGFEACSCGKEWPTREAFLKDPNVRLVGYQADFSRIDLGLLLFNHSCGTSLSFAARDFIDLYDGPVFTERATGSAECPGHCLHQHVLDPCPAACECASIRALLQIVAAWPKQDLPRMHRSFRATRH